MANWASFTVRNIVDRISNGDIVLPDIQRPFVWEADKMEELFDSLFRQNSFGSIICTEEKIGSVPLFPYRPFTIDGRNTQSANVQIAPKNLFFVIDGQQRLQSFYIGLCGKFEEKTMFYDLFSDYRLLEYSFKFSARILPRINLERSERIENNNESQLLKETLWIQAPLLFIQLKKTANPDKVADWIFDTLCSQGKIKNDGSQDLKKLYIRENVRSFRDRIFNDRSIGISKVDAHMFQNLNEDRRGILKMFLRLNSNGTKLSTYELIASTLKCFDYRMGRFLDDVTTKYADIGIKDQDVLIKMLLVFQDEPNKDMVDITADDAIFATRNLQRIQATFDALRVFLRVSGHEEWFRNGSVMPLYFLAYHIFHKSENPETVRKLFDRFDTNDKNFKNMSLWLKVALLNKAYKVGCGWTPTTTGMRLTHQVLSAFHGGDFPVDGLFALYKRRLHHFFDNKRIIPECLDLLDQEYIFYLIYGRNMALIRVNNKDHIHPRILLEKAKVMPIKINSIGNLQLLEAATNQVQKNGKEFKDWVNNYVLDKRDYMALHLIPPDESLWTSDRFNGFLRARLRMIADKIKSEL